MYYCAHNTAGLIWGSCCRKFSDSSSNCNEIFDSQGNELTQCSSSSPFSEEMKYYYCLTDQDNGMKACGFQDKNSKETLTVSQVNQSFTVSNIK